ncbi:mitotic checkpoint protein BUB3.3-like isoform X1 [Zingiber officinale]|uniref:mitotic checkpoint protein BUB3.3-like isoform X1 n=1 Tax=Zingiber officinale TaxID=94328 RepID=UPI001C4C0BEB|nr:mitotic checkpoint protein BUB3.3-like isoform X1 [Zingiber officinale]
MMLEGSALAPAESILDAISRIRFAPQTNDLLVASWDGIIRLYDVDRDVLRFKTSSNGALLDCCFEDERAALSASSDGCIQRYDFSSESQNLVGNHDDSVTCIDHSKETGQFISAGLDKKLMFWDMHMKNGSTRCTKEVDSNVWSLSLCHFYLIAAVGNMISTYDLRNLSGTVQMKKSPMNYQITCVRSFSDKEGYAIGSVDGCVALEHLDPSKSSEMRCIFRCHPKSRSGRYNMVAINDIAFHPCSKTFVSGDNEGYAIVWDLQSKKRLCELQRYPSSVSSLSYNHSGEILAISSSYTYQEANEVEEPPQIFISSMENIVKQSCLPNISAEEPML